MLSKLKRYYNTVRNVVPMEKRNKFFVYGLILLGTTMDNLNSMSTLTMTENIQKAFKTNSSTTSWVLSGYGLTLGSFIMVTGKISDIIGPHNLYLMGIAVIWISSLICALLPHTSIIPVIVFRAIQGIGASSLLPSTIAMTANYFSGENEKYRGPAVAIMIVVLTATLGLGIVIGGAFSLTNIGYQGFFYFVFAYSFLVDTALLFLIIPVEKTIEGASLKLRNINFVSSFLMIVGCLLVILGLTEGGNHWVSAKAIAPVIVGFFTIMASFLYESYYIRPYQKRHANDYESNDWRLQVDLLFPAEILRIPNFPGLLLVCGIYYATMTMNISVVVQYHNYIDHDSTIISALKAFTMSVGLVFGAVVYRESYYKKIGLKIMFILSGLISLGAVIWLSRLSYKDPKSFWVYEMVPLLLFGYGFNMFFNIYLPTVINHTPLHLQGVVNGVFQTFSQIMLSIGNALIPSIIGNIKKAVTLAEKENLHKKFVTVCYVIIGFQAVSFLIVVFFINVPRNEKDDCTPEESPEKSSSE